MKAMIGVLMVLTATLFAEISTTTGKIEVAKHKESVYSMGFLATLWGTLIFVATGFVRDSFLLSLEVLPMTLLAIRVLLDIVFAHLLIVATVKADRTTVSFLRVVTVPLLLLVDFILGYTITTNNILGIMVLATAFLLLMYNHDIHKKGAYLTLLVSVISVATISLFKYNITFYNSVETEQSIVLLVLLLYFFLRARHTTHEHPLAMMRKPVFLIQSLAGGAGTVLASFAVLFGTASIIIAAKRSSEILWAVLSGNIYFHERHLALKIFGLMLIVSGLVLLAL